MIITEKNEVGGQTGWESDGLKEDRLEGYERVETDGDRVEG